MKKIITILLVLVLIGGLYYVLFFPDHFEVHVSFPFKVSVFLFVATYLFLLLVRIIQSGTLLIERYVLVLYYLALTLPIVCMVKSFSFFEETFFFLLAQLGIFILTAFIRQFYRLSNSYSLDKFRNIPSDRCSIFLQRVKGSSLFRQDFIACFEEQHGPNEVCYYAVILPGGKFSSCFKEDEYVYDSVNRKISFFGEIYSFKRDCLFLESL